MVKENIALDDIFAQCNTCGRDIVFPVKDQDKVNLDGKELMTLIGKMTNSECPHCGKIGLSIIGVGNVGVEGKDEVQADVVDINELSMQLHRAEQNIHAFVKGQMESIYTDLGIDTKDITEKELGNPIDCENKYVTSGCVDISDIQKEVPYDEKSFE